METRQHHPGNSNYCHTVQQATVTSAVTKAKIKRRMLLLKYSIYRICNYFFLFCALFHPKCKMLRAAVWASPNFIPFQSEAWLPRGLCPPPHQSLPFSHISHWNIGEQKLFLRGVLEFRKNVPMDARNNFYFGVSFRKRHLTHQDTTCPPSLALDP